MNTVPRRQINSKSVCPQANFDEVCSTTWPPSKLRGTFKKYDAGIYKKFNSIFNTVAKTIQIIILCHIMAPVFQCHWKDPVQLQSTVFSLHFHPPPPNHTLTIIIKMYVCLFVGLAVCDSITLKLLNPFQ